MYSTAVPAFLRPPLAPEYMYKHYPEYTGFENTLIQCKPIPQYAYVRMAHCLAHQLI